LPPEQVSALNVPTLIFMRRFRGGCFRGHRWKSRITSRPSGFYTGNNYVVTYRKRQMARFRFQR
jgi:hypothetical protein